MSYEERRKRAWARWDAGSRRGWNTWGRPPQREVSKKDEDSDESEEEHRKASKAEALLVTVGAIVWFAIVALIVAKGTGN
ncbi:hypothetical protein ACIQWR_19245 [Streptomyces sp. NPDC098789]|uniref:hypothetical protein n=1 Tax=Streptomyces sp. NPDC098789 TaxID=3366098 RepID=UPI0038296C49